MYNWWKLSSKKVHREAVRSRIEFFMNSTSLENRVNTISRVHSPYLTHYLLAVCDNNMEKGQGPMFTFCIDELFKRGDLTFVDLKMIAQAFWMKENVDKHSIPDSFYKSLIEQFSDFFD
jgi:hypothetical protein